MGLPLYCVSQRSVVPVLNSRIHGLSPALPVTIPPFSSRPMHWPPFTEPLGTRPAIFRAMNNNKR